MTLFDLLWICGLLAVFAPSVGAAVSGREAGELLLTAAKCERLSRRPPYSRSRYRVLLAAADGLRDRSEAIIAHGYALVTMGALFWALLMLLLIAPH